MSDDSAARDDAEAMARQVLDLPERALLLVDVAILFGLEEFTREFPLESKWTDVELRESAIRWLAARLG